MIVTVAGVSVSNSVVALKGASFPGSIPFTCFRLLFGGESYHQTMVSLILNLNFFVCQGYETFFCEVEVIIFSVSRTTLLTQLEVRFRFYFVLFFH